MVYLINRTEIFKVSPDASTRFIEYSSGQDAFCIYQTLTEADNGENAQRTGVFIPHHPDQEISTILCGKDVLQDLKAELEHRVHLFSGFDVISSEVEAEEEADEEPEDSEMIAKLYDGWVKANQAEQYKTPSPEHTPLQPDPLYHHVDLPSSALHVLTEYDPIRDAFIVYYVQTESKNIQDYEGIVKTSPKQEVVLQEVTIDALISMLETRENSF